MLDLPVDGGAARRVSGFDVARHLGLSQPTVSRALNDDPLISAATRTRVREAAEALGYVPNRSASRLRRGRTSMLGIIVTDRPSTAAGFYSPMTYALLGATCAAAAARGMDAMVSFQSDPEQHQRLRALPGEVDALIVIGSGRNSAVHDALAPLHRRGFPVAYWGVDTGQGTVVLPDNMGGSAAATAHLIASGRRSIVCVGVEPDNHQFDERAAGYAGGMVAAALAPWIECLPPGRERGAQGAAVVDALLAGDGRPDAIFAACDTIAFGVLGRLAQRGVAVPDDIAVIGFDGLALGASSNPPLTSVATDTAAAAAMLVDAAVNPLAARVARVPAALVVRASG